MPKPAITVPSTITVGVADKQTKENGYRQAAESEHQADTEEVAQEAATRPHRGPVA